MTGAAKVLRTLVGPALCLLALPTSVAARYLRQTPADVVAMRGMPAALGVCLVGLLLLRFAPCVDARGPAPPFAAVPSSRPSRWVAVAMFVAFIFATVPVGSQIATAILVRIGHAGWVNSINAAGAILALLFLWYVFRQRELRRRSVVTSLTPRTTRRCTAPR